MTNGRLLVVLSALIIGVVVVTGQPVVAAVILPLLTGLLVVACERWASERHAPERPEQPASRGGSWLELLRRRELRSLTGPLGLTAEGSMLLTVTLCLLILGVVMVHSATAEFRLHGTTEPVDFLLRFVIYAGIGLLATLAVSRAPLSVMDGLTGPLLVFGLATLVFLKLPGFGSEIDGPRRWLGAGPTSFRPAELVQVPILLYAARFLAMSPTVVAAPRRLAPLGIVVGCVSVLIASQPDLGSTLLVTGMISALLVATGIRPVNLAIPVLAGSVLLAVYAVSAPYRLARFTSFISGLDTSGPGYQSAQAQIAVGSGGLFGRGLGHSVQKLYYVPRPHTDSILAVIGEEFGAVGICLVLALFGVVAYAGFRIATSSTTTFGALLATGATSLIVGQAIINIYGVLGLAPVVGVGLPLVSYSATDVVTLLVVVGVLVNTSRRVRPGEERRIRRLPWELWPAPFIRRRIALLFAAFLVLLLTGAGRALYLGILDSPRLKRAAARQQLTDLTVPARRGTISDRNAIELAGSARAFDVAARPAWVPIAGGAVARLSSVLGVPQDIIRQRLAARSASVHLARGVSASVGRRVAALRLPGIETTATWRRVHPRGTVAAAVLGLSGADGHGLSGLEYRLDRTLTGRDGRRRVLKDGLGAPLSARDLVTSRGGHSVRLTLDAGLQTTVERVLGDVGGRSGALGLAAVVLDTHSGDVLAMANWPALNVDPPAAPRTRTPTANRTIDAPFQPGAAFVPVTVAGALQDGLVTAGRVFRVPRALRIQGRGVRDPTARGPRLLTTTQILASADPVGSLLIGGRLGAPRLDHWARRFGFGRPTGVGLPGESAGGLPALARYTGATMASVPIGRGIAATGLQLARAYAAIADDGVLRVPRLVARIGSRRLRRAPAHRIVSTNVAVELRGMLRSAHGMDAVSAGSATATTWAPSSGPRIVISVLVQHPRNDEQARREAIAAQRRIRRFALPYLGF